MERNLLSRLAALLGGACLLCTGLDAGAATPYLPLWEYIPDGEPYIFEDPDHPGQYRVYIYGSHDIEISAYCGRDQVVWSAPVDDLRHWRFDGVIFESRLDANGQPLNPDGKGDILYAPDVVEKIGGFDEDYRFFFEDADLSLRVRKLGRRLAIVPGVRIFHYGSATIGANDGRKAAWFRTGYRIFLRKWYSFPRLRGLPPFLGAVAWHLVRGRFGLVAGSVRGYFAPLPCAGRAT